MRIMEYMDSKDLTRFSLNLRRGDEYSHLAVNLGRSYSYTSLSCLRTLYTIYLCLALHIPPYPIFHKSSRGIYYLDVKRALSSSRTFSGVSNILAFFCSSIILSISDNGSMVLIFFISQINISVSSWYLL